MGNVMACAANDVIVCCRCLACEHAICVACSGGYWADLDAGTLCSRQFAAGGTCTQQTTHGCSVVACWQACLGNYAACGRGRAGFWAAQQSVRAARAGVWRGRGCAQRNLSSRRSERHRGGQVEKERPSFIRRGFCGLIIINVKGSLTIRTHALCQPT